MKVAVVKYNAGNIRSVDYALKRLGVEAVITADKEELQSADKVIFPGVGEAETTMNHLKATGLDELIKNLRQPVLGICLGMQLMCRYSEEGGVDCLNIFDVDVKRFVPQRHEDKVPHMGWNTIGKTNSKLFEGFTEEEFVYFVHSFYVPVCDFTAAETDYIHPFSAALHKDNFYATQFHPEKSSGVGLKILQNFINVTKEFCEKNGVRQIICKSEELDIDGFRQNPKNRCYLCKHYLFGKLLEFARDHGVTQVLDGTNEDDLHVYRPGRKALREYGVISPLAACHVTKTEVKALAAKYGVSVAHRPSTPCMATRLPYGAEINYDVLDRIADGEAWLHTLFGAEENLRLRVHGDVVRLEIAPERMGEVLEKREEMIAYLKKLGFSYLTMDLEGFRSGSMDEKITQKEETK